MLHIKNLLRCLITQIMEESNSSISLVGPNMGGDTLCFDDDNICFRC